MPPSTSPRFGSPASQLATVSLAGLAVLLAACGGGPEELPRGAAPAPIAVETALAETTLVPVVTVATASVEPWRRVAPGTKMLGRVDEVRVEEGDRVRQGELLARLESRDLEAAVAQARAAIRMADATLENARAQQQRMAGLAERGSATPKNLEDATAALRIAEATREQAEANLAAAQVDLGYAEVRSPIAGAVVAKHVEAGDMAAPGAPLFVIEDLSRVKLDVRMPETEIAGVTVGAPARAEIAVLDRSVEVTVDRIVPAGDPVSRTYSVLLALDNPDGAIKSGMFARVSFLHGEREALLVPRSALVERGQLRGVFVVGEGPAGELRSRLRYVKVREAWAPAAPGIPAETADDAVAGEGAVAGENEQVEVLSGLDPGERYVTTPPASLTDGSLVEVAAGGASRAAGETGR